MPRTVHVLLLPQFHALDFAGPVQAIFEANGFGAEYELRYVSPAPSVVAAQGFVVSALGELEPTTADDWIVVPGTESSLLHELEVPASWLRAAVANKTRVSSICSGAFILAKAGILEGRSCTTHWKLTDTLAQWSPGANVLENRLYVRDGNVTTSAGLASGIDLTLSTLEEDHGAELVAKVAREMVVFLRRSGESAQQSVFLENRAHTHAGVHRVQDWIMEHPDAAPTLEQLASVAAMSSRHLTRVFRRSTGITVHQFVEKVRLELARNLVHQTNLSSAEIARRCGYGDPRQLRRVWKREHGGNIRSARRARPDLPRLRTSAP